MSEQERRRRWIAACRLERLNVTRYTRICSKHFEGGLGPTKANPVPTIFDFPENLQRKEVKPRQDPEGRRLKNAATTSKIQKASKRSHSKVRKFPDFVEQQEVPLKKNESCTGEETGNQDLLLVTPELNLSESLIGGQQNLFEKSRPAELNVSHDEIKDKILFHDKAVQTDLSADRITRMEQAHFKLQDRRGELKRELFMVDVQRDDSSVRFYTGLPSLSCLLMLFDFLKPIASSTRIAERRFLTGLQRGNFFTREGRLYTLRLP